MGKVQVVLAIASHPSVVVRPTRTFRFRHGSAPPVALDFAVIGGGLQGATVAADLAGRKDTGKVTVIDVRKAPAAKAIRKISRATLDVFRQEERVSRIVGEADACIVALPGSLAIRALPAIVAAGAPIVDISFTPEVEDKGLDAIARKVGVPLVRDVGVAPGLSHILAASSEKELGGLTDLVVYVGGFPQHPTPDAFRHAVYFNPLDLMSEYLRPARVRVEGKDTALTPLDPERAFRMRDADVGRLEAFPSDGLRSLLTSYPKCPSMMEYTLRWPGHLDEMRRLAEAGKLAPESVARTAHRLAKSYPANKFPDYLLMEVYAMNRGRVMNWRLLDRASKTMSAMSRTTAFTAAAAAHVLARGDFKKAGAHPPEALGKVAGVGETMISDLRKRGVVIERARKLHVFLGRRSLED